MNQAQRGLHVGRDSAFAGRFHVGRDSAFAGPSVPARTFAAVAALLAAAGCGRGGDGGATAAPDGGATVALAPQGKVLEAAENEAPAGSVKAGGRGAGAPPSGPPRIDVPAGKLAAGSTPGDKGRDPALEPALLEVELGGFTIDRWLCPNDPGETSADRRDAWPVGGSSASRTGGRLCTEPRGGSFLVYVSEVSSFPLVAV